VERGKVRIQGIRRGRAEALGFSVTDSFDYSYLFVFCFIKRQSSTFYGIGDRIINEHAAVGGKLV
jgi:hypothetical protein